MRGRGKPGSQAFEDDERAADAVHEAGHAVANCDLGIPFTYVTIKPDPKEGSLGHVDRVSLIEQITKIEEKKIEELGQEPDWPAPSLEERKEMKRRDTTADSSNCPELTKAEKEAATRKMRESSGLHESLVSLARDHIVADFAGPVAQEAFGFGTGGHENDSDNIATATVLVIWPPHDDPGEEGRLAKKRDLEWNRGREKARDLVQCHRLSIIEVANQLLLHETLSKEQVKEIMQKNR